MKSRGCTSSSSPSGSSPSVVVAAASRPAARNRNRQLGQSMPNVRHHSSRHVRDFFISTYTRILVLSLFSSFLLHFYFFFFFSWEKDLPSRLSNARYRHVAPRTSLRSDFPLQRRKSVGDCGIYARPRLTIPSTARLRASQTAFSLIVVIAETVCESIARRNLINLRRWNFVNDGDISCCALPPFGNFISTTFPTSSSYQSNPGSLNNES